jgi:hypothetical protein
MTEKDIKPPEESTLIGYPPPINAKQKKMEAQYEEALRSAINHLTEQGTLSKDNVHNLLIEPIERDGRKGDKS